MCHMSSDSEVKISRFSQQKPADYELIMRFDAYKN